MSAGAGALGGKAQAARLRVGERDEIGHRLRGAIERDREQLRKAPHQRDRPEILDRVVGKCCVKRGIGRVGCRVRLQESVPVRRGLLDHRCGDDPAAARARLDHERLAGVLADLLIDDALERIGACTGREWNDDGDWTRGEQLRGSPACRGAGHGQSRGEGNDVSQHPSLPVRNAALARNGSPNISAPALGSHGSSLGIIKAARLSPRSADAREKRPTRRVARRKAVLRTFVDFIFQVRRTRHFRPALAAPANRAVPCHGSRCH